MDTLYHSLKYRHADKKDPITVVNALWSQANLVAVTSRITVGCNYDVKGYFDRIYAIASGYCSMFQATYRVRHVNDKMTVSCLDKRHTCGGPKAHEQRFSKR